MFKKKTTKKGNIEQEKKSTSLMTLSRLKSMQKTESSLRRET